MDDTKSWLASRTIWGALLAIIAPLLGRYGYHIDAALQADVVTLILTLIGAGGGVIAIIGRIKATKAIGSTSPSLPTALGGLVLACLLGSLTVGGPVACSAITAANGGGDAQIVEALATDYAVASAGVAVLVQSGRVDADTAEKLQAADRVAGSALYAARAAIAAGDSPGRSAAIAAAQAAIAELVHTYATTGA